MKAFVLDIETGARPLAEIESLLPTIEPPSNWKDETKRAEYVRQRREDLLHGAALDATLGRILCVGVLHADGQHQFIHDDESEADLLRRTWRLLATKSSGEVFVTYNGTKFDWPFIFRRSLACGVPVPDWFPRDGRWPRHAHVDLAEWWSCGDRSEHISLDRLLRLCGLPGKTGNGAAFAKTWVTDRAAALDYLANDLRLTRALYDRMAVTAVLPVGQENGYTN